MEDVTKQDVQWLLDLHKKERHNIPKHSKKELRKTFLWALVVFFGIIGLIMLPFFVLIRTSVYLYLTQGIPGWIALLGGIGASVFLLLIYMLFLSQKIKNQKRRFQFSLGGAGIMVFGYCLFSLFYLSGVNAQSPEVRDVYRSLHPIMRVAVSTITLADSETVITDIERISSDYIEMGLPINPNSLHYVQPETGYVHAIDLRTRGRGFIRNYLLQASFEVMGFQTLRHVGTADHLHVSLPVVK